MKNSIFGFGKISNDNYLVMHPEQVKALVQLFSSTGDINSLPLVSTPFWQ